MVESDYIFDQLKPKELLFYVKKKPVDTPLPKYRNVFDEDEIDYLYVDFIFYNKYFDEKDWSTSLTFKAYKNIEDQGRKEIENIVTEVYVPIDENKIIVTESVGSENVGEYWDYGYYTWEVWHEDILLMSNDFYIEPIGIVTKDENPYFDFLSLKLFEAPSTIPPVDQRKYLSRFMYNATRFIWAELQIQNKNPNQLWMGEFVINFYNDIKELVGRSVKMEQVYGGDKNNTVTIFGGIGSDTQVTWPQDLYTVEVVFMDTLIVSARFEVGESENTSRLIVDLPVKTSNNKTPEKELTQEEIIFAEINKLVGLGEIKKKLHEYYAYAKYLKLRQEKGLEELNKLNLNFVFAGNPGTGKTTVAKLLGKIYKSLGLLPRDSVFEVDRGDLVGRYIGETAPQTKEVIDKARGGILFIDEAYALWRDDEKDFGRESIEVLVKELSDGKGNLAVIVAGYPKEMKGFIESNPGLKSRFNTWYEFPDYTPDELMAISEFMSANKMLEIAEPAKKILYKIIVDAYRKRDRHFGNARFVSSLIEEAQINLGLRVMEQNDPSKLSVEEISTINSDDVEKIRNKALSKIPDFPIDEDLLKKSLLELNTLVGLSKVKTEIKEIVKLVRFYKESKKEVLNSLSLHNVLTGNPGTGKTTVARIIANIYRALGLLEKGHLVECSRDSLVAGFIGQTAIKTKDKIDEAMGGVLFIDEAYSLSRESGHTDYGEEAVEIILQAMDNQRGKFSVIVAGYTGKMIDFLTSNPGLRSRFDNIIEFEDYDTNQLLTIAKLMLKKQNIDIESNAENHLHEFFNYHYKNKNMYFGNARFVRKIIDQAIKNMYIRLADLPQEERTDKMLKEIKLEDVRNFKGSHDLLDREKQQMGFTVR